MGDIDRERKRWREVGREGEREVWREGDKDRERERETEECDRIRYGGREL